MANGRLQCNASVVTILPSIDNMPSNCNQEVIMTYNDSCAEDYGDIADMLRLVRAEILSRRDQLELPV